ncbi:TPA: hypothetical protein DEO28_02920 [Candidatus Dependentiae bacterium]|nr:MAG: hypothetical protein UR14_C0005G0065 [candidate division TM6 bacterium GW2011_GWE2_31_21]KKP53141.1 MAG: hypothetical protein UR43_C0007G0065 [candidate division TM6 bacterium GW2011_GWF2_33_332]HBS47960.1 hypothetical protein [Candidatus Dependentiae bacterium]HBZ73436.1 hypothetical protein [Candidatus Dependentiae bacterium]
MKKSLILILVCSLMVSNSVICKTKQQTINPIKQKIEKLYLNKNGFNISPKEYEKITNQGGAPTYGEITYESLETIIKDLKMTKKDIFCDLGCGIGKVCVQVRLTTPVKKSIGIELSESRVKQAQEIKTLLERKQLISNKGGKILKFYKQNILEADLKDVTVVFMCSTCFSEDLMKKITKKLSSCKKGLKVVTLKQLPANKQFVLQQEKNLAMSWSSASPVYFYKLN